MLWAQHLVAVLEFNQNVRWFLLPAALASKCKFIFWGCDWQLARIESCFFLMNPITYSWHDVIVARSLGNMILQDKLSTH